MLCHSFVYHSQREAGDWSPQSPQRSEEEAGRNEARRSGRDGCDAMNRGQNSVYSQHFMM